MARRVSIRSRSGNVVLGVIGAIYFFCAVGTLFVYLISSWRGASMIDRVLQLALLVAAVAGVVFLSVAADNLGWQLTLPRRRAGAATSL